MEGVTHGDLSDGAAALRHEDMGECRDPGGVGDIEHRPRCEQRAADLVRQSVEGGEARRGEPPDHRRSIARHVGRRRPAGGMQPRLPFRLDHDDAAVERELGGDGDPSDAPTDHGDVDVESVGHGTSMRSVRRWGAAVMRSSPRGGDPCQVPLRQLRRRAARARSCGQRIPVSQPMSARVGAPERTVTAVGGQRGNAVPVTTTSV